MKYEYPSMPDILPFSRRQALDETDNSDLVKYGLLKRPAFETFYAVRAFLPPGGMLVSRLQEDESCDESWNTEIFCFIGRLDIGNDAPFAAAIWKAPAGYEAVADAHGFKYFPYRKRLSRAIEDLVSVRAEFRGISGHEKLHLRTLITQAGENGFRPKIRFRTRRVKQGHPFYRLPPPFGLDAENGAGILPDWHR